MSKLDKVKERVRRAPAWLGKKLAPGSYSVVALVDYGGPNLVAGQANITVR